MAIIRKFEDFEYRKSPLEGDEEVEKEKELPHRRSDINPKEREKPSQRSDKSTPQKPAGASIVPGWKVY